MAIERRYIVDIPRGEIESLKTRNHQLERRLLHWQQAFRPLDPMHGAGAGCDPAERLDDRLILASQARGAENGPLTLVDGDSGEPVLAEVIGTTRAPARAPHAARRPGLAGSRT